jgi:hypothetical protein
VAANRVYELLDRQGLPPNAEEETMGWFDKLLGRETADETEGLHQDEATPDEHERHLEQSANPGTAPVVPPDRPEASAAEDEVEREEPKGEEKLEETRGRDDQEGRLTREPPRPY